jgi:toxin YxiD
MKEQRLIRWLQVVSFCGLVLWIAGCGEESPEPRTRQEMPRSEVRTIARNTPGSGRFDLSTDEDRGGHTLKKHVGQTDEELRERLQRELNIAAASTWMDRDTAEKTVGEALRINRGKIENWKRRGYPRSNLALHFNAGRVIGRSMRHGESQSSPCTRAVIVLKADGAENFHVLTTYPEARD